MEKEKDFSSSLPGLPARRRRRRRRPGVQPLAAPSPGAAGGGRVAAPMRFRKPLVKRAPAPYPPPSSRTECAIPTTPPPARSRAGLLLTAVLALPAATHHRLKRSGPAVRSRPALDASSPASSGSATTSSIGSVRAGKFSSPPPTSPTTPSPRFQSLLNREHGFSVGPRGVAWSAGLLMLWQRGWLPRAHARQARWRRSGCSITIGAFMMLLNIWSCCGRTSRRCSLVPAGVKACAVRASPTCPRAPTPCCRSRCCSSWRRAATAVWRAERDESRRRRTRGRRRACPTRCSSARATASSCAAPTAPQALEHPLAGATPRDAEPRAQRRRRSSSSCRLPRPLPHRGAMQQFALVPMDLLGGARRRGLRRLRLLGRRAIAEAQRCCEVVAAPASRALHHSPRRRAGAGTCPPTAPTATSPNETVDGLASRPCPTPARLRWWPTPASCLLTAPLDLARLRLSTPARRRPRVAGLSCWWCARTCSSAPPAVPAALTIAGQAGSRQLPQYAADAGDIRLAGLVFDWMAGMRRAGRNRRRREPPPPHAVRGDRRQRRLLSRAGGRGAGRPPVNVRFHLADEALVKPPRRSRHPRPAQPAAGHGQVADCVPASTTPCHRPARTRWPASWRTWPAVADEPGDLPGTPAPGLAGGIDKDATRAAKLLASASAAWSRASRSGRGQARSWPRCAGSPALPARAPGAAAIGIGLGQPADAAPGRSPRAGSPGSTAPAVVRTA